MIPWYITPLIVTIIALAIAIAIGCQKDVPGAELAGASAGLIGAFGSAFAWMVFYLAAHAGG